MTPHLLRVERPVVEFGELVAAVRQSGLRAGWLDLAGREAVAPEPLPADLTDAAEAGVLRAVAIGGGRSVALKPMRGEPVLRDVLREHFRGCHLVLVRGRVPAPRLTPAGPDRWVLETEDARRELATDDLVAALRKPRPF